jgi:omega-6 fatty acid desaturase (delta-12 desaturase)
MLDTPTAQPVETTHRTRAGPANSSNPASPDARDWVKVLSAYREPNMAQSTFELAVTLVPFLGLWGLAWLAIDISLWLTFALCVLNAGFLLRLFCIQHDCGHGSFFASKTLNDSVGRAIGVLTLTPYDVWKRSHAIHHGASGNLGRRGLGDIKTLTVDEYRARSAMGRLLYRLYRHPLVLFGIGPAYMFLLEYRLPMGLTDQAKYWVSAMATNGAILAVLGLLYMVGGWAPILFVFVPTAVLAATAGVWMFYVQHQFEATHWEQNEDWQLHEAALHGSSHYVLPKPLQWLSANIGIHHVHHLYSRIPFYRLPQVLRDHPSLADHNRMTIAQSFATVKLQLWDERSKRLMSLAQARAVPA